MVDINWLVKLGNVNIKQRTNNNNNNTVNGDLLSLESFKLPSTLVFILCLLLFFVISCPVVAVQSCIKRTMIPKISK